MGDIFFYPNNLNHIESNKINAQKTLKNKENAFQQNTLKNTVKNKGKTKVNVKSGEKAYFERVIDGHEHLLDGFFTVRLDKEKLIMSEMNEIIRVFALKKITENTETLDINDNRLFELEKYFINKKQPIKKDEKIILLSSKDSIYFKHCILSKKMQIHRLSINNDKNLQYGFIFTKDNISQSTNSKESALTNNSVKNKPKNPLIGGTLGLEHTPSIIYNYQDPVVRMVCEYLMLLDTYFTEIVEGIKVINKREIDKYVEQRVSMRATDYNFRLKTSLPGIYVKKENNANKNNENLFYTKIRTDYFLIDENGERIKRNGPNPGYESSICAFGVGKTDCCSRTLRKNNLSKMFLKYDMFNLDIYDHMTNRNEYKNYTNMEVDAGYQQVFRNVENLYINKDETHIYDMKFVFLCNLTIQYIIEKSGRAEGGSKTDVIDTYPPISIIEVLDPNNMTWIVRSERYHLSKSPCVHLGLKNKNITDKLATFFNLVGGDYRMNVWFHSIGHALDKLFCGYSTSRESNAEIYNQILKSFGIFYKLKKNRANPIYNDNLLLNFIPMKSPEILFYVSTNYKEKINEYIGNLEKADFDELISNYIKIRSRSIKGRLIKMTLEKQKMYIINEINGYSYKAGAKNMRRLGLLDESLRADAINKNVFYDMYFSYPIGGRGLGTQREECRKLKTIDYGCKADYTHPHIM
jgi:hypothetical protein